MGTLSRTLMRMSRSRFSGTVHLATVSGHSLGFALAVLSAAVSAALEEIAGVESEAVGVATSAGAAGAAQRSGRYCFIVWGTKRWDG